MVPSAALRAELRRNVDEVIPTSGTDADTRFSTAEIDELLTAAETIAAAAAEGWTRKALRAMSERGGLQRTQAGSERFEFVTIESYREHCLQWARYWRSQIAGLGSRIYGVEAPDVLGVTEETGADISRLV